MTNGFMRRKQQSKEDIRKAGFELFSQFGVGKVSIVDIAHKAGVSQATIYNNFGSKDALAREFVSAAIDRLVSGCQEILTPDQPFWEKMAAFIQFISTLMAQGRASPSESGLLTSSQDLLNDPEIRKIHDSAREKMTSLLLGLVREGKEQGQIDKNLSDDAFRIYFRAMMDMFIDPEFQRLSYRDPQLTQNLGVLMIYGLGGQRG